MRSYLFITLAINLVHCLANDCVKLDDIEKEEDNKNHFNKNINYNYNTGYTK